jgi:hypothetical protein
MDIAPLNEVKVATSVPLETLEHEVTNLKTLSLASR